MSSWSVRRQLSYLSIIFLVVLGIGVSIFVFTRDVPTCFDDIKNGTEIDIDCGGGCEAVCASEADPIRVRWARVFRVKDGVYTVAAFLHNQNLFAAQKIDYHIRIYDDRSILLAEREGTTFVNPDEQFVIVEHRFETGSREAVEALVELTGQTPWQRSVSIERPVFIISNKMFESFPTPRASATVKNDSLFDVGRVHVTALVFNAQNNVIAASTSFIDEIPKKETRDVFFTWPEPFTDIPVLIEVYVRTDRTVTE